MKYNNHGMRATELKTVLWWPSFNWETVYDIIYIMAAILQLEIFTSLGSGYTSGNACFSSSAYQFWVLRFRLVSRILWLTIIWKSSCRFVEPDSHAQSFQKRDSSSSQTAVVDLALQDFFEKLVLIFISQHVCQRFGSIPHHFGVS